MIRGAQDVADERDYVLILANTDGSKSAGKRSADALLDRRVDAVVYATMYHRMIDPPTNLRGLPLVLLNARADDDSVSWVVPDEAGGATAAVEHLIGAGHRRIGFLDTDADPAPPASGERRDAYRAALSAHGLPWGQQLEASGPAPGLARGGLEAALRLLDKPARPTALFCFNDRIAAGAYQAAHRLGLLIPEDLSIVGFDNQILIADSIDPGLTTVQLPHADMGRWAMERALALLDEHARPSTKRMPCALVERGSVAPPNHR
jgi:LacI family transcriptional regulator